MDCSPASVQAPAERALAVKHRSHQDAVQGPMLYARLPFANPTAHTLICKAPSGLALPSRDASGRNSSELKTFIELPQPAYDGTDVMYFYEPVTCVTMFEHIKHTLSSIVLALLLGDWRQLESIVYVSLHAALLQAWYNQDMLMSCGQKCQAADSEW